MKIDSVSSVNRTDLYNYNNTKVVSNLKNPQDSVSFKGYESVLSNAVKTNLKKEIEAEHIFQELFKSIIGNSSFNFLPEFSIIRDIYVECGFRGLLHELKLITPCKEVKNMLEGKELHPIPLVTSEGHSIFEIFHFGKSGFSKNSPNDIRLIFRNKADTQAFEFSLGDCLNVTQTDKGKMVYSEFYPSTGTKRLETINEADLFPETTYYNKDGSRSFWKNWLLGGIAAGIY